MRRLSFREVVENCLAYCGQKFDGTLTVQQSILSNFINMRLDKAWSWGPWPEWTYVEERAFADDWDATTSYVEGDMVWVSQDAIYYVALQSSQGKTPATETGYWAQDTTGTRCVSYEQYGKIKIQSVWQASSADPRTAQTCKTYKVQYTSDGLVIPGFTLDTVWLKYSPPAPRFTADAFLESKSYRRYDLAYFSGEDSTNFPHRGEVYYADLDVNGNPIWVLVQFPLVLSAYVCAAAGADMLRYYGKVDESKALLDEADEALFSEARKAGIRPELQIER